MINSSFMKQTHINIAPVLLLVTSALLVSSCYDKFDPDSYKPPFTISGFSAASEIQPSALVGYWSFDAALTDEVSGTAASNKGTNLVNGFKGMALNLDVANKSYITFEPGSAITGLQSFTISFWVNPTFVDANADNSIDGILGLVNLSNKSGFWGNLDWFVENGSNPDAAKIVVHVVSGGSETWFNVSGYNGLFGAWSNHTVTYDAATSTFKYFINGSPLTTATAGWTGPIAFANSGPMVIGAVHFQTTPSLTTATGSQDWASYLSGGFDELRIYNKALSAEEVNALVVLQGKGK
jgi:hypothetical protein